MQVKSFYSLSVWARCIAWLKACVWYWRDSSTAISNWEWDLLPYWLFLRESQWIDGGDDQLNYPERDFSLQSSDYNSFHESIETLFHFCLKLIRMSLLDSFEKAQFSRPSAFFWDRREENGNIRSWRLLLEGWKRWTIGGRSSWAYIKRGELYKGPNRGSRKKRGEESEIGDLTGYDGVWRNRRTTLTLDPRSSSIQASVHCFLFDFSFRLKSLQLTLKNEKVDYLTQRKMFYSNGDCSSCSSH